MARVSVNGTAKKKVATPPPSNIVGEVVRRALNTVKPNPWNPNVMTVFEKESLKNGLLVDGWMSSQALLIWGTDEKGKVHNLIIDGEHRWTAATDLKFSEGPMVVLNRLPAANRWSSRSSQRLMVGSISRCACPQPRNAWPRSSPTRTRSMHMRCSHAPFDRCAPRPT